MALTELIAQVASAFQTLTKVARLPAERDKEVFEKVIHPLHEGLVKTGDDYRNMLTKLTALINAVKAGKPNAESDMLLKLDEIRNEMSTQRRDVGAMARQLQNRPEADIKQFGYLVDEFFEFQRAKNGEVTSDIGRLIDTLQASEFAMVNQVKLADADKEIARIKNHLKICTGKITDLHSNFEMRAKKGSIG